MKTMRIARGVATALVLAAGLSACDERPPPGETDSATADDTPAAVDNDVPAHELWGTSWRLEDLAGHGVVDRAVATLEFPGPGRVVGNGSCNRFFGDVKADVHRLDFGPLGATRKLCAAAVSDQESRYLAALAAVDSYSHDGPFLLLTGPDLEKPLRFTRLTPDSTVGE